MSSVRKYIWILLMLVFGLELNAQEILHLNSTINTDKDEFLPYISEGSLYFGRTYLIGNSPIQQFQVYKFDGNNCVMENTSDFSQISVDLNKLNAPLTKLVEINAEIHRFFMFATNKNSSRRSLFLSKSTKYHDFHPALNQDKTFMVFVSDRTGSIGESDTTTDLYITYKISDGLWSEPYNLGSSINTSQNDISPFIDKENNLYFSSKRFHNGEWNYDIFKAEPIGKGKWGKPVALDYPVNTEFNETGAMLIGDSLFFSSDRSGGVQNSHGFSNYDLYCYLMADNGTNEDLSKISVTLNIEKQKNFSIDFSQYKVPFFVTGYYLPNTSKNLSYLKKCFSSGIYGTNPQTCHISNPDLEPLDYHYYAKVVDGAIEDAVSQSLELLENVDLNSNSVIEITFTGYADSRPILNDAIYDGKSIRSSNPLFTVDNGDHLDNTLLSKLRAYYTSELFIEKMGESHIFKMFRNRIIFKIKGNGSDLLSELPDFEKRRVIITLNVETRVNNFRSLESQLN